MEFRKHFGYDVEAASNAAVVDPATYGPSLTIQSQSEDADINLMMHRMGVTGKFPENPNPPMYGDFAEITDFASALAAVADASARFNEFPADVRARFQNDPQLMLEFVGDGGNLDEAIRLGLVSKDVVERRQAEKQKQEDARQAELLEVAKKAGFVRPAPGST